MLISTMLISSSLEAKEKTLFFDLEKDPNDLTNQFYNPEYAPITRKFIPYHNGPERSYLTFTAPHDSFIGLSYFQLKPNYYYRFRI